MKFGIWSWGSNKVASHKVNIETIRKLYKMFFVQNHNSAEFAVVGAHSLW